MYNAEESRAETLSGYGTKPKEEAQREKPVEEAKKKVYAGESSGNGSLVSKNKEESKIFRTEPKAEDECGLFSRIHRASYGSATKEPAQLKSSASRIEEVKFTPLSAVPNSQPQDGAEANTEQSNDVPELLGPGVYFELESTFPVEEYNPLAGKYKSTATHSSPGDPHYLPSKETWETRGNSRRDEDDPGTGTVKPIARVKTELDLSESLEAAEGSNGPVLNFEGDKQTPKLNGNFSRAGRWESAEVKSKKIESWEQPILSWTEFKVSNKNLAEASSPKQKANKKTESLRKRSMKKASETSSDSRGAFSSFNTRYLNKEGPIYKFVTGYAMKPRDDEEGEDAYFAFERGLGVADGVSGWSTYGINSSVFSQRLMEECEDEIRAITKFKKEDLLEIRRHWIPKVASYVGLDFQANTIYEAECSSEESSEPEAHSDLSKRDKRIFETPVSPLQALSAAYGKVTDIGSSTATVAVLNCNEVEAVNLGDSGFIHFSCKDRQYNIQNVSKEQQHEFNVPYQLSYLPSPDYLAKMESEGRTREARQLKHLLENGKICKDEAKSADIYTYEAVDGDIFILGTDGLFDNIFSNEAKNIVNTCMFNVSKITPRVAKVGCCVTDVGNR